jgi:branched-chain amino acid transport system substrate-binding protein
MARIIHTFFSLLFWSASFNVFAESINVGVILPLSGELSVFGNSARDGIVLASEKYPGQIHLHVEDDQYSNAKTLTAYQKLSLVSGIRAVLGPFGPGPTLTIAPLAQRTQTPIIAVALCDKRLTDAPHIFCLYPRAQDQLEPAFDLFKMKSAEVPDPNITTAALLMEELDGMDEGHTALLKFLHEKGAQIVSDKKVASGTTDFRPLLAGLRNVDLFVYGGFPTNAILLFRQMNELSITPRYRWLWTELDDNLFRENRAYFDGAFIPGGLTAITPEFKVQFLKRFGRTADLYAAVAHDGAASLFEVLQKEPAIKGTALISALAQLRMQSTAIEHFHFNPDRSVSMPMDIAILEEGKTRLLRRK